MNSALYSGWIGHRRFAPRRHEFRYRIGLLYLDLSEQDAVFALSPLAGRSRFAPFSFRETDYLKTFTGRGMRLIDAVRQQVAARHRPCTARVGLPADASPQLGLVVQSGEFLLLP